MCAVSAISNYGISTVLPSLVTAWSPKCPYPDAITTEIALVEYNALLRKAKEYDERTNQPECPDPEKMAKMEEFCKKFETMGTEMFKLANELRNILK